MYNEYKSFVEECIKNRQYLDFTYKDMANCLTDVNPEDYANFENFKYKMSKDNLIRIARVLCIKKPVDENIEKYIDTDNLTEEEIKDLSKIISGIVGDDNA